MTSEGNIADKGWGQNSSPGYSDFKTQLLSNHCTVLLFSEQVQGKDG